MVDGERLRLYGDGARGSWFGCLCFSVDCDSNQDDMCWGPLGGFVTWTWSSVPGFPVPGSWLPGWSFNNLRTVS